MIPPRRDSFCQTSSLAKSGQPDVSGGSFDKGRYSGETIFARPAHSPDVVSQRCFRQIGALARSGQPDVGGVFDECRFVLLCFLFLEKKVSNMKNYT